MVTLASLARYRKTVLAILGVAATLIVTLGVKAPWAADIVAVTTALGVYLAPNAQKPQMNVIDHGTPGKT